PDRREALRPELAVRVQREDLAFLAGEVLFLGAAGEQRVQSTSGSNLAALAHEQGEEVRFVGSGLRGDDGGGKRHRSGAFYSGSGPPGKPLFERGRPEPDGARARTIGAVEVPLELYGQPLQHGAVQAETEIPVVAAAAARHRQVP